MITVFLLLFIFILCSSFFVQIFVRLSGLAFWTTSTMVRMKLPPLVSYSPAKKFGTISELLIIVLVQISCFNFQPEKIKHLFYLLFVGLRSSNLYLQSKSSLDQVQRKVKHWKGFRLLSYVPTRTSNDWHGMVNLLYTFELKQARFRS